jgi:hypothetical protein
MEFPYDEGFGVRLLLSSDERDRFVVTVLLPRDHIDTPDNNLGPWVYRHIQEIFGQVY